MTTRNKGTHQVHLMMDVVMRKGNEEMLMLPGQAFPIPYDIGVLQKSWDLELWVFSALFSNDKIYTNYGNTPMTELELRAQGLLDSAKTSKGFGLTVLSFNEQPVGLFYGYYPGSKTTGRWHDALPVSKFFELEQGAVLSDNMCTPFVPNIYAKLKSGSKERSSDKLLWDISEGKEAVFRQIDIPVVLADPDRSSNMSSNCGWICLADLWWCTYNRIIKSYMKAHPEFDGKLYLSWGTETDVYYDKKVNRKEYNDIKTFICKTNRVLNVDGYSSGDPFESVDIGRYEINSLNDAVIKGASCKTDYIGSL